MRGIRNERLCLMMHMQEIETSWHTSAVSKAHPEHVVCTEATPHPILAGSHTVQPVSCTLG